jgi:hypothetical protein
VIIILTRHHHREGYRQAIVVMAMGMVGEAAVPIIVVETTMMMIIVEGIGTCDVVGAAAMVVDASTMTDDQPIEEMTMIIDGMMTVIVNITIIVGVSGWEREE